MANFTEKQLRNIGEAALTGQPAQDVQSDDSKMSVAETKRLQAEAQARINASQHPNQIGSAP
jgi:hypothetical protein